MGKLLWIGPGLQDAYAELFLELRGRFYRFFRKGKLVVAGPGEPFGNVRLFDFIGFLKHEFRSESQIRFGNSLLAYVST